MIFFLEEMNTQGKNKRFNDDNQANNAYFKSQKQTFKKIFFKTYLSKILN